MGETVLNILHLSDIHFKKSLDADDQIFRRDVQERLVEAVGKHFRDIGPVDMVAVTGDIAFSGTETQYHEAEKFLNRIKSLLPDKTPILAVPGNHDVNRKMVKKALSLHGVVERRESDDILADKDSIAFLVTPKMKCFYDFANRLRPGLYPTGSDYSWTEEIPGKDGVAVLGLNTAWASENDMDKSYITLGYPQFMKAKKATGNSPYRILLMHHPLGWLEEADFKRFNDDLFGSCGLILHGHEHIDSAVSYFTPTDSCLLVGANAAYTHDGYIGFQVLRVVFTPEGVSARIWPYRLETRGKAAFVPDTYRWKEAQRGKAYFDMDTRRKQVETAPTPEVPLEIPAAYRDWLREFHSALPLDHLARRGEAVRIDLPAVYIPLETDNPFYKPEGDQKKMEEDEELLLHLEDEVTEKETDAQDEPRVVDIEVLAGRVDNLLLRGKAGMGKTTLVRHLAYRLAHGGAPETLEGRLPVLVFFKDLWPLFKRAAAGDGETVTFAQLLRLCLQKTGCPLDMERVEAFCRQGRALFLLDGLDEVPETQRPHLLELLRVFLFQWRDNRFIITGRPHGIEGKGMLCFGKYLRDIHELNENKSHEFIQKWFRAVSGQAGGVGRTTAAELIHELEGNEKAAVFKGNPLLLTALCIFYLVGGKRIPDQRADLYDRVVGNLLYRCFHDPADPERVNRVREFLMLLAYTMHRGENKNIDEEDALEVLAQTTPRRENEKAVVYRGRLKAQFAGIEPECGLLNRDGGGDIRFAHLSFQEFLAAKHMLDADIDCDVCLGKGWWEEALLLYAGLMNLDMKKRSNLWVRGLLDREEPGIQLLGAKGLRDFQASRRDPEVTGTAREKLLSIIVSREPLKNRFDAGELLGHLGDSRINPLNPPMEFVEPGPFTMGSDDGRDNEKPVREIELEGFWMGKFPVTNMEFAGFIADGGYETEAYWPAEGWKWKVKEKIKEPRYWRDRQWNGPNFPVVGVSWYEAQAYLTWLSKKTGEDYRLPNEAQWEKAARGKDGRTYPWGNTFDKEKCNSAEGGLMRTSPVGIYPAGKSPYGCLDMAGNVREWMDNFYDEDKGFVALRGGSWLIFDYVLRCSARLIVLPLLRVNVVGFRASRPSTKDGS